MNEIKTYCHRKSRSHDLINTKKNFFYSQVTVPNNNGCMFWLGSKNKKGYGQINVNNKPMLSHRFSYMLHYGAFDNQLCVLHKCDMPSCVAPEHLFLGTKKDNMRDCANKGRLKTPNYKGQNSSSAKLLDCEIPIIRKKLKNGLSCKFLGEFYNVHPDTILSIKIGRTWSHI